MPNDAKLGLVVGVGLVIAVGVIFYRKDAPTGEAAAIDKAAPALPSSGAPSVKEAAVAKATGARRHTVQAGETLTGLARQYLGDESKVETIRELNPSIQGPADPPAGTLLLLPDTEPQSH
jgi:nucleoid-associated protein YgaU